MMLHQFLGRHTESECALAEHSWEGVLQNKIKKIKLMTDKVHNTCRPMLVCLHNTYAYCMIFLCFALLFEINKLTQFSLICSCFGQAKSINIKFFKAANSTKLLCCSNPKMFTGFLYHWKSQLDIMPLKSHSPLEFSVTIQRVALV